MSDNDLPQSDRVLWSRPHNIFKPVSVPTTILAYVQAQTRAGLLRKSRNHGTERQGRVGPALCRRGSR